MNIVFTLDRESAAGDCHVGLMDWSTRHWSLRLWPQDFWPCACHHCPLVALASSLLAWLASVFTVILGFICHCTSRSVCDSNVFAFVCRRVPLILVPRVLCWLLMQKSLQFTSAYSVAIRYVECNTSGLYCVPQLYPVECTLIRTVNCWFRFRLRFACLFLAYFCLKI